MMLVAGNKEEIPLLGWITLRFSINKRSAYHGFDVVKNLPIDMLIGAEFLRPDEFLIVYTASGRDAFGIKHGSCDVCLLYKEKMKAEQDTQLQATPKRTPAKRRDLPCVVVQTRLPEEQERRREKLCNMMGELKIDLISVSDSILHELVSVWARRLDASAGDDDDVGYTTLIEHRIETGNSPPFRQQARPIPYLGHIFIDRELNRQLRLCILSQANPGEWPYASPIVVVATKHGTLRMCVDYRQHNQMTSKDAYPLPQIDEFFTSLNNAYCFLALDMLKGYQQNPVRAKDRPDMRSSPTKTFTFSM